MNVHQQVTLGRIKIAENRVHQAEIALRQARKDLFKAKTDHSEAVKADPKAWAETPVGSTHG